jgi:predicted nucleic acid-binding protein
LRGLLDTSVLVAQEHQRDLGRLPEEAAISVMTLAELHVGVLLAGDPRIRARRLRTLARVEGMFDPLPVDAAVSRVLAEILADARRRRRHPRVVDALIAATSVVHGLPLYSRDRDFELMPGVDLVIV